ncbi:MAG: hypothetical protein ACREC0_08255 [Methylocella sp.]
MFSLRIQCTSSILDALKNDLTKTLPHVKSSHRVEALARGLGFGSNAAIRTASQSANPTTTAVDGKAFLSYLSAHEFDAETIHLYRAAGRVAIEDVLKKIPQLSMNGFGVGRPARKPDGSREGLRERQSRLIESRKEFLSNGAVEQFLLSLAFLARVQPTKTIRPNTNSYSLKHRAESYACSYPEGDKLGPRYVSNGAFIAAAVHAGFAYKTYADEFGWYSLNVSFNMAKSSLDILNREIQER